MHYFRLNLYLCCLALTDSFLDLKPLSTPVTLKEMLEVKCELGAVPLSLERAANKQETED